MEEPNPDPPHSSWLQPGPELELEAQAPDLEPNPSRRDLLVVLAGASCGSLLGLLSGCSSVNPAPVYPMAMSGTEGGQSVGSVDLKQVPELATPGGSIKVRTPQGKPILIWRAPDGRFGAVAIRCTHRGCEVAYNAEGKSLDCPCHGSRFGLAGEVMRGPARRPLESFAVTVDEAAASLHIAL